MKERKDIAIAFMNDHVSDEEFINQFETGTFPAASFHHREHVRVVWLYLQRYSVLETLARFSDNLKCFAAANGRPNLYHETITWSYVFLINERIERNGKGSTTSGKVMRTCLIGSPAFLVPITLNRH
jgi:hypothetical protein